MNTRNTDPAKWVSEQAKTIHRKYIENNPGESFTEDSGLNIWRPGFSMTEMAAIQYSITEACLEANSKELNESEILDDLKYPEIHPDSFVAYALFSFALSSVRKSEECFCYLIEKEFGREKALEMLSKYEKSDKQTDWSELD